jgi:hypothetical protein
MDTEIAKPPGTVLSDLYGSTHAPEPAPPTRPAAHPEPPLIAQSTAPAPYVIEVSNGSVHTEVKFNRPSGKQ